MGEKKNDQILLLQMNSEALIHRLRRSVKNTDAGTFSYLEVPILFTNISRIF